MRKKNKYKNFVNFRKRPQTGNLSLMHFVLKELLRLMKELQDKKIEFRQRFAPKKLKNSREQGSNSNWKRREDWRNKLKLKKPNFKQLLTSKNN